MFNAFYAQSGGVTSVINASACGLIEVIRRDYSDKIGKLFAGKNGILGALEDDLIDTSLFSDEQIAKLKYTPGGAFGSCRVKLSDPNINKKDFEKIINIFKKYNIRYFFYNGGGDSQDTTYKLFKYANKIGYKLQCIGIPKTIDNDLPHTDFSPGFPSTAKYVAVSILEAGLDIASMAKTSTKVFILEVMGRNAGWIAAAAGLAGSSSKKMPHIILFPEIIFDINKFLLTVDECVKKHGYCTVVASEGIKDINGDFVSASTRSIDSFGHNQLGGVAAILAGKVKEKYGYKYHWALADYLQRSARHIASKVDVDLSYELGKAAVDKAISGISGVMLNLIRNKEKNTWVIGEVALDRVKNMEQKLPSNYIDKTGYGITQECRDYLLPLIQGEAYPIYKNGLPDYGFFAENLEEQDCLDEIL
jgi:ATP-dependent phosphofructokinase / diphosphate-dependent phosphofructokinase